MYRVKTVFVVSVSVSDTDTFCLQQKQIKQNAKDKRRKGLAASLRHTFGLPTVGIFLQQGLALLERFLQQGK